MYLKIREKIDQEIVVNAGNERNPELEENVVNNVKFGNEKSASVNIRIG